MGQDARRGRDWMGEGARALKQEGSNVILDSLGLPQVFGESGKAAEPGLEKARGSNKPTEPAETWLTPQTGYLWVWAQALQTMPKAKGEAGAKKRGYLTTLAWERLTESLEKGRCSEIPIHPGRTSRDSRRVASSTSLWR